MPRRLRNVGMYAQFHSVKEPSKNHDIWVGSGFSSLLYGVGLTLVRVLAHSFCFPVLFGSWQNMVLVCSVFAGFGFFQVSNSSFF